MRFRFIQQTIAAAVLTATAIMAGVAYSQDPVARFFQPANPSEPADWADSNNWDIGPPEAQFNESGIIGNNYSAYVASTPPDVGRIVISNGTLEIRSGGSLTAVPGSFANVLGELFLGQGSGVGNLVVRRGGTLNVHNVITGGNVASQITLGEAGGAGIATFSITGGTLNRTTRIIGPNVNFSSSGNIAFASPGTLVPVITGATHSSINVTGSATLGGTVRPEFNGYTPVLGNSWNLVSATEVSGQFSLDLSQVPATPRGTTFRVNQSATAATLQYTNTLILTVDRATGQTRIENAVGNPISLEGYSISSPDGNLGGAWNSLQDQNVTAWDEADNASSSRLTEFKPMGSSTLSAGNSFALGSPYVPPVPTALGEVVGEDLSFEYAVPGQGTVEGIVEYSGPHNNLVLTIDPATGRAAIQNESPFFAAELEGYTITSTAGLLQKNNGQWLSLQDQNLGGWDEADNSSSFRLTEFNPTDTTTLAGGAVLNLGTAVNVSGGPLNVNDFTFQFALSNGTILQGIVALGELPTAGSNGDFNHDGDVDGGDFLIWQRGGSPAPVSANDLAAWKSNYGTQPLVATSAAVPEPASLSLASLLVAALVISHRRPNTGSWAPMKLKGRP